MSKLTSTFGAAPAKKPRKSTTSKMTVTNDAGTPAFETDKYSEYLKTLLTNVLGQTFYVSEEDNTARTVALHDEMAAVDPEFVSKALPYARNRGYMRSQPVLGLAALANGEKNTPTANSLANIEKTLADLHKDRNACFKQVKIVDDKLGTKTFNVITEKLLKQELEDLLDKIGELGKQIDYNKSILSSANSSHFEKAFDGVIQIPNDLMDFMTVIKSTRNGEGGRLVKRKVAEWLRDNLTEYNVIKYGSTKEGNYSLRDLIRTTHPKGLNEDLVKYILDDPKRPADLSKLPQIKAFEDLKKATTYTEKANAIKEGRLPHEVVTPFIGKDSELWLVLGAQMPIFAFMRNLATLERHGVINKPEILDHAKKVFSKESVEKSKIFPFRFIDAENHTTNPTIKGLLRQAVEYSFSNIPDIGGRTAVFLDRSGSMSGNYMKVGSLYGISLMKKTGNGRLLLFDSILEEYIVSKTESVMNQVKSIHARGGTSTNLPMEKLLNDNDKVDTIILITDEQQNSSQPFFKVFEKYRNTVNKEVKLFIINVASYKGSLVPIGEKNVFEISGWSDKVLTFISLATKGFDSMAQAIRDGAV